MDEEDLAEADEAQSLQTSGAFAGLGSTGEDEKRKGFLMDIFKTEGETMGVKLLRKMGWKDGYGIGPRVRRKARLQDGQRPTGAFEEEHLFAPGNTVIVTFKRKDDRKGLGFTGEERLSATSTREAEKLGNEYSNDSAASFSAPTSLKKSTKQKNKKGGFGVGVLNDSDEEDDPFEMGPRLSYNRVIGGDKRKEKVKATVAKPAANPLLSNKPVFTPKRGSQVKESQRKCHDGRLPINGFVVVESLDPTSIALENEKYPIPQVPEGWKSSRQASAALTNVPNYQSTAEAAKQSKLDHKSRANILGESSLPGKSVFDFLSPAARDRLAAASGKSNLPTGKGEIPEASAKIPDQAKVEPKSTPRDLPELDKNVALAALGRGVGGWMPYADNEAKRARYRWFLEFKGGVRKEAPECPADMLRDQWAKELEEFAHAAEVFKPMSGTMASRFTTASTAPRGSGGTDPESLLNTPAPESKPEDPAEAAAKMGMFGPMTRREFLFHPTRLVCKRFGVRPPDHVTDDADTSTASRSSNSAKAQGDYSTAQTSDLISQATMDQIRKDASIPLEQPQPKQEPSELDSSRNEAIEGPRAGEALFKAIFGSDDDESDA